MRLSVIVPVYNVEKFLPRCLDSLLRQDMGGVNSDYSYEIICVNDGSPDNCGAILAEYEKKHPDIIHVITQKNGGLSAARNTGMLYAQGEYLAFIDSDDYVVDGAFHYLLDHFCSQPDPSQRPDVLNFRFRPIFTDGTTLDDPDAKPDGEVVFDGDGADEFNRTKIMYVWTNLYRREFIQKHDLKFEIVVWEDEIFNFDVYRHHPHLVRVSCNVNRYEQYNGTSIMRTQNKERVLIQLNDLYLNITTMHYYLESEENPYMAPAAVRAIRSIVAAFVNKMGHVLLTRAEWKRYILLLRPEDVALLKDTKGETLAGCVIQWLKYFSLYSYIAYRIVHLIYRHVFDRGLRKQMIKN